MNRISFGIYRIFLILILIPEENVPLSGPLTPSLPPSLLPLSHLPLVSLVVCHYKHPDSRRLLMAGWDLSILVCVTWCNQGVLLQKDGGKVRNQGYIIHYQAGQACRVSGTAPVSPPRVNESEKLLSFEGRQSKQLPQAKENDWGGVAFSNTRTDPPSSSWPLNYRTSVDENRSISFCICPFVEYQVRTCLSLIKGLWKMPWLPL